MPSPAPPPIASTRQTIARIVTALVGGYAVAGAAAALVARLTPVAPQDATAWGLSLSFAFYVAAMLWGLADRDLPRVMLGTWGGAAALAIALDLLGRRP